MDQSSPFGVGHDAVGLCSLLLPLYAHLLILQAICFSIGERSRFDPLFDTPLLIDLALIYTGCNGTGMTRLYHSNRQDQASARQQLFGLFHIRLDNDISFFSFEDQEKARQMPGLTRSGGLIFAAKYTQ
jgi:hypothetical protein